MGYVVTRENIMDLLVLAANDSLDATDITFSDDFRIHIKINGEKWTGSVNYIVAQYIVKLQRNILSIHNKLFPDEHLSLKSIKKIDRSLLVDVEIKEGCTELLAWLKEIIESQFDKVIAKGLEKMSSKQIFALIVIVYVIYCGKEIILEDIKIDSETTVRIEQNVLDKLREVNNQETRKLLIDQVGLALDIVKDNSDSFKYLRSNISSEDSISAVDFDESLSGYDIKGKKRDKVEKSTVYVDGSYTLKGIKISPNTAIICSESGDDITASIDLLSDTDKIILHDMNKNGDLNSQCPIVGLHVTAQLKDGSPEGYAIVGVNSLPRPGSKPFTSVHGSQKNKPSKCPADFPLSKLMNIP
jgi:hypothetical protein